MRFHLLLTMKGGVPVEADLRAESYPLHPVQESSRFFRSGKRHSPWTPPEKDDVLVASFVVSAESSETVDVIAESCPHLLCGDVEVRQIYEGDA